MSFIDKLKKKAGDTVDQHGDKITEGIDKAGGAVSRATNGKYDDKIDKGVGKAKEGMDKLGPENEGPQNEGPQNEGPKDGTGR